MKKEEIKQMMMKERGMQIDKIIKVVRHSQINLLDEILDKRQRLWDEANSDNKFKMYSHEELYDYVDDELEKYIEYKKKDLNNLIKIKNSYN